MTVHLNLNKLSAFVGDDPDLIKQMLGAYLRFLPKSVEGIRAALESRRCQELLVELHQLKPNLENIKITLSVGSFDELYDDIKTNGLNSSNHQMVLEIIYKSERVISLIKNELRR
jgi:hypothetical protein